MRERSVRVFLKNIFIVSSGIWIGHLDINFRMHVTLLLEKLQEEHLRKLFVRQNVSITDF